MLKRASLQHHYLKTPAHELGHIMLHSILLLKYNMTGSNKLAPLDLEADVFAKELLRLYRMKDHCIN